MLAIYALSIDRQLDWCRDMSQIDDMFTRATQCAGLAHSDLDTTRL